MGVNARSSAAAEKSGEGMALKIFTGAKPFLKADIKPFGITGIEMLPKKGMVLFLFSATYGLLYKQRKKIEPFPFFIFFCIDKHEGIIIQ
jgi:hypothetical protein